MISQSIIFNELSIKAFSSGDNSQWKSMSFLSVPKIESKIFIDNL